jgi:hypothetical protein
MADEQEPVQPRAGLADFPDVVDLRVLSDDVLERRGMDLRQRIADARSHINRALEERSKGPPITGGRALRTEWFVQELELVVEALRGALADVDREQERRAEVAARGREHRILNSTRWSAIVQAACAVVLASITWWYASLTRDLLHAQIQPELEARLDRTTTEFVLDNPGSVPIVDLRVDVQGHTFIDGKRRTFGGLGSSPCRVGRLEPGASARCALGDAAAQALNEAVMYDQTLVKAGKIDPESPVDPVVVARVSYRRRVDGKQFRTTHAFVALCCGPKGEATLHSGLGVPKDVDDAIRDLAFGSLSEPRRLDP